MPEPEQAGRHNQRRRTRKDLLSAAAQLMKDGRKPTMEEISEAAMVSRATAYRYFPNVEALLIEAPLDSHIPSPADLFANDRSTDVMERMGRVDAALHDMIVHNEGPLRLMLASTLSRGMNEDSDTPIRQNRRTPLIEAALAPARAELKEETYQRLCAALAMIVGIESFVVFRDVLQMSPEAAREVKTWALQALVKAAFQD